MGIRGLTTYIKQHSTEYLENIELHDTLLVIDGNNLMCHLYNNPASHCSSCFGGDYNIFTQCCERFFNLLRRCKIRPLVIFDGGHERRKLNTIKRRLRNKIQVTKQISPSKDLSTFPLMIKENFLNVLIKMKIEFAQTLFEADDIIASLARQLNCPVLSNDSDFFIYDVQYIPFPTVKHQIKFDKENNRTYIQAKKYSIEYFLESFGGMNKEMLPLLATILGNDYIHRKTFSNFFSQIKMPKNKKLPSNSSQKLIVGVLEWLRNEDFETAKTKILNYLPKFEREKVLKQMNRVIRGYNLNSNIQDFISALKSLDSLDLLAERAETEEEEEEKNSNIDPFFKKLFTSGRLPSYFMDIISLKTVHWAPQVEDFSQSFSQEIGIPIFQIILGILLKKEESNEQNEFPIKLFARTEQSHMHCIKILPTFSTNKNTNLPTLSEIENLKLCEKIKIIEESFNLINQEILNSSFPSEWSVYFIAIEFWIQNSKNLNLSFIYSLILSIIYLNIVLKKCKVTHHKQLIKKYGEKLEKRTEEIKNEEIPIETHSTENILDAIKSVSMDDCILFVDKFIQFQNKDEVLLNRPHLYNQSTLHKYAQFQSCLQMAIHLNALLDFPFQTCPIENLFSGTFIYNIYEYLYIRGDVDQYLEQVFASMPTLFELFKKLKCILIPADSKLYKQNITPYIRKKKRRKNRTSFAIPTKETFNKFESLRIS